MNHLPRNLRILVAILVVTFVASSAHAQFTWTGNVNNQWGIANNWGPVLVPPAGASVKFGLPNNASIDLGGNRTVGSISFSAGSPFKLNNNTLKIDALVETSGAIAGSHEIASNVDLPNVIGWDIAAGAPLEITGAISGNGGISKIGDGDLTLSSTNTFTGDTTIAAGKIIFGAAGALEDSTVDITIDNGLDINGFNARVGALEGSGDLDIGSQDFQTGFNGASTTYSGVITGTIDSIFRHRGTGTLTLTGGTNATPSTIGTLHSQNATGEIVVSGARIDLLSPDLSFTTSPLLANTGDITLSNGADVRALTTGAGLAENATVRLEGIQTSFTGHRFDAAESPGSTGSIEVALNSSLNLAQGLIIGQEGNGDLTVNSGGSVSSQDLLVAVFGTSTSSVLVSDAGSQVTVNDALLLGGNDAGNFGGNATFTVENGGAVSVANNTKFLTFSSSLTINGGTLETNTIEERAPVSGTISISDPGGGSALTVGTSDGSSTFRGLIQDAAGGAGSIKKVGSGLLTLTGANTFTGGMSHQDGGLQLEDDAAAGTGTITAAGGTFLTLGAGLDIANAIDLQSDLVITTTGNATHSGVISGAGNLTKSQSTTLTLLGSNTFTGDTSINGGGIVLGNADALQNSMVSINVDNGLDMTTNAINANLGALAGSGDLDLGTRVARVGSNGASTTYSGVVSGTSSSAFIFNGTGTLTLTGGDMATPSSFGALRTTTAGGHLVVDGAHMDLSFGGTGLLNNALDVVQSDMTLTNGGEIDLGTQTGLVSQGILNVTGAGTLLAGSRFDSINNGNLIIEQNAMLDVSGTFYVAFFGGPSEANVRTGGMASVNNLLAGVVSGDIGTVLVQDETSLLSANRINLGGSSLSSGAGTGVLLVEGGATVEAAVHTALLTSASTVTVNGGSLLTSTLRNRTGVLGTVSISDPVGGPALTVGTNDGTSTFDGLIQDAAGGPGSLKKVGTGTFTLTGANTYTGDTNIDGGAIALASADALQNSTVIINVDNGLDVTTNLIDANLGGLAGSGDLDLGSQNVSVGTNGASTTYSGVITGSDMSRIRHTGAGTLTLTGGTVATPSSFGLLQTETAGGGIIVEGAHVNLTSLNGTPNSPLRASNGDITLRNGAEVDTALANGTVWVEDAKFTVTGAGSSLSARRFDVVGVAGEMIVEQGGALDAFGASGILINNGGSLTVRTGGTVVNNALGLATTPNGTPGSATIADSTSVLILNNLVIGGTAGGTGTLTVQNGATATVAFNTTLSGLTSTLEVSGATLTTDRLAQGAGFVGTISISDPLGDPALTVGTNDGSSTFSGLVQDAAGGPGSLKKVGTGTFTLTGANTYTGDTIVDGGTLSLAQAFLADMADVLLDTTATLDLTHSDTDLIDSLFIDGLSKPVGTHGAIGSGADFEWSVITGTGMLEVATFTGTPGDFDGGGDVDGTDFLRWQRGGSPNPLSSSDLAVWQTNYGASTPALSASSAVPEPTSLLLVFAAALCCGFRQRFETLPT